MRAVRANLDLFLFVLGLILLAAGCIGWAIGNSTLENVPWITSTIIGIVVSTGWMVESFREGRFGVDIIAVLALVGALIVGEPFAGAMITVMLVTGRVLEERAQQRARRDLSLLVQRAPRTARRVDDSAVDRTSGAVGDGTKARSRSSRFRSRTSGAAITCWSGRARSSRSTAVYVSQPCWTNPA